jgi:hypothetical protein
MKSDKPSRLSRLALKLYLLMVLLVLVLTSARTTNAQVNEGNVELNRVSPRVIAVSGRLEVGQTITVDVDHLSDWSASHDPRKLVPYLNGRTLPRLYPEEVNLSENRLLFHLDRTPESKQEWGILLQDPVLSRPVSFSVGLEDKLPFETVFDYDHRLNLTVIPKTWGIVSAAAVLGLLVLLVYLGARTNILREAGSAPGAYTRYDLGRVQSAVWFFVISISYLCLWLITGDLDTLTPSILGLMGISAVTALGPHLLATAGSDQDQSTEAAASSSGGSTSRGFITDILSDHDGYSFHRFQIVLWTGLLAIIFLCSVYDDLAMPKFGGALMALMGISAATYLGFEVLGQKSTMVESQSPEGSA